MLGLRFPNLVQNLKKKKKTQLKAVRITQSNFNYYTVHL